MPPSQPALFSTEQTICQVGRDPEYKTSKCRTGQSAYTPDKVLKQCSLVVINATKKTMPFRPPSRPKPNSQSGRLVRRQETHTHTPTNAWRPEQSDELCFITNQPLIHTPSESPLYKHQTDADTIAVTTRCLSVQTTTTTGTTTDTNKDSTAPNNIAQKPSLVGSNVPRATQTLQIFEPSHPHIHQFSIGGSSLLKP